MPDLAAGFAAMDGTGIVAIHRGNVDSLWPYSNAMRHRELPPFLPEVRVFTLPAAPDFLGAGDFDADGHWDLVAASLGGKALYLLRGDGRGGFAAPQRIDLPGAVTALATGEINRVDGLTDIAVGVSSDAGSQVLVFESPAGALRAGPETFPLPAAATALAMLPLDDDPWIDLAVGAGNQLVVIHGRDRKLSHSKQVRESVAAAAITTQNLPFAVRSLAVGRFTGPAPHVLDLAALGEDGKVRFLERPDADYQAARAQSATSLGGRGELPAPLRPGARPAPPLPEKPQTRELIVRDEVDLPDYPDPGARLVAAHTSITGADDVIVADARAARLHVISRQKGSRAMRLAASLEAVAGAPVAVLGMRMTPSALDGLVVLHKDQSEPSVLLPRAANAYVVTNTQDAGTGTPIAGSLGAAIAAAVAAGGTSTISFNIPTTDPGYDPQTGAFTIAPLPEFAGCGASTVPCQGFPWLPDGLTIDGYTQPGASPNTLATGNNAVLKIVINGASAGTGSSGFVLEGGGISVRGLVVNGFATYQLQGGYAGGARAIDTEGAGNFVEGNFLGTDSTGTVAVPDYVGITSWGGPATIGGTTTQARNLISGNALFNFGSNIESAPNSYFIQGNYLGTDRTGTQPLQSGSGGVVVNGTYVTIGGTTAGAGNLISGNNNCGLCFKYISTATWFPDYNLVQGNLIGTDATGTVAVPNGAGLALDQASNNLFGGTTPSARNVVSGNYMAGFVIYDSADSNNVQGNYVGVDVSGANALPNSWSGIQHDMWMGLLNATGTLIGGDVAGAGNVISGNSLDGIDFGGAQGLAYYPLSVLGNLIGTDATGAKQLPNGYAGISITEGGSYVTVGGTDATAGNVIAFNSTQGILINPALDNTFSQPVGHNTIVGNTVFSNGAAGVWVASGVDNQVSENSIYGNGGLGIDVDAVGPLANSTCQTSTGGANKLQNSPVLTPAAGATTLVTATATDPNGNTSELSNCAAMALHGNTLNIVGSLNSLANTSYTIEFFENAACDPSGYGQGKTFLHRIGVTTDASCNASFGDNVDIATADLSVSLGLTTNYTSYDPGSTVAYQAVAANNGASTANSVAVTDTLPAGLTFVSATTTQGACNAAGSVITCSLGTMPSGSTATIIISATVTGTGTITNGVTVGSSTTPDPNPANNSASASITSMYSAASIDHLSPTATTVGSGAVAVTIYLFHYYPGATTVTANGTALSFTFLGNQAACLANATCAALSATIPAKLTGSAGVVTISAANPSQTTASTATFTVYPSTGLVTQFLITGIPNPGLENAQYTMTLIAANALGQPVAAYRGTVYISCNWSGSLTLNPTSPYTFTAADQGQRTFTISFPYPGSGEITASDYSASPAITGSYPMTVTRALGSPKNLQVSGATNEPIGYQYPTFSAVVQDADSNGLPGITVTWTVPSSGASGTFSNGALTFTSVTDSTGTATAVLTANLTAGIYAMAVTASGLKYNFTLQNLSRVPAHITIYGGDQQSIPVNTAFSFFPEVLVTDANNNAIGNIVVTFSTPSSGAGANLATSSALTAAYALGNQVAGEAIMEPPPVANGATGTYFLTATVGPPGNTLSANFTLTNTAGPNPVAAVGVTSASESAVINTSFASPLVAEAYDAHESCLAQVPITFTVPQSGPSAKLSATQVVSDPATCKAQVTAVANGIKGSYTLTVTTPNGVSGTVTLTNTGPSVYTLSPTSGTPQTATIGTAFAVPLQATLLDPGGNPVAGQLVTFSAPSAGASATLSASYGITSSAGVVQIYATASATAGAYAVTASYQSLTATFSLTNAPPTPGSLTAAGGTPQGAVAGTAFAIALQALVTDMNGNPMAGVVVSFTPPASGASAVLSSSTALTNAQGVASVNATANLTLGNYVVTASAGTLNAQFSLINTLGAPATVTATGGTPQSTGVGLPFMPLQATVKDVNGNPLAGILVIFSAPSSGAGATLSPASALTGSNGVGSVTATANQTVGSYSVTAAVNGLAGSASYSLTNLPYSPCDVNRDHHTDILDVQKVISEALGNASAIDDLNYDQKVDVVEIQIIINAVLKLGCAGG